MSLDLTTAMKSEQACIQRALQGHPWNALPNVLFLGVGGQAGARWASSLEGRPKPSALISMGFAGGLHHSCRPNAIVLSQKLMSDREPEVFHSDPQLLETAAQACRDAGMTYHMGSALTVRDFVFSPAEKIRLGQESGALCCSMEDYWLAKEAHRIGVPFLAARVVLDPAEQDLPSFVINLANKQGAALAVAVLARWWRLPQLMLLARRAGGAEYRLRVFTKAFCSQLLSTSPSYLSLSAEGTY